MPSIADIPTSPAMSKKRRREDLDSPIRTSNTHFLYEPQIHTDDIQTRHFLPYAKKRSQDTGIKRQRIDLVPQSPSYDEPHISRPPLSEMTDHQTEIVPEKKLSEKAASKGEKVDLSACHICHRKPTEKKQLDQYADCEGCGNRTCYICFRECKGLFPASQDDRVEMEGGDVMIIETLEDRELGGVDGKGEVVPWEKGSIGRHRRMICSSCCVEKGVEGEVWCLGCLRTGEGG